MNRYSKVHTHPKGPGDGRPSARQIIKDENLLERPNKLVGKTVLITGGTSGLGFETAKAMHATGAKVFITGRCDVGKGQDIASSIQNGDASQDNAPQFVQLDLADLDQVRNAANEFQKLSGDQLNILICNAGVMAPQELKRTKQGHELQFGVNYLAHFLLFKSLESTLIRSSSPEFQSRAVIVASCAHRSSTILKDGDYDFAKTSYEPLVAYGQSKTANIHMANEIERRFGSQGVHGLSVHPGVIMETGLVRHLTDDGKKLGEFFTSKSSGFADECKNSEQGAASIVWAAVSSDLEDKGGIYLENCGVSRPVEGDLTEDEWYKPGRASWCYDELTEETLWNGSERIISGWL